MDSGNADLNGIIHQYDTINIDMDNLTENVYLRLTIYTDIKMDKKFNGDDKLVDDEFIKITP